MNAYDCRRRLLKQAIESDSSPDYQKERGLFSEWCEDDFFQLWQSVTYGTLLYIQHHSTRSGDLPYKRLSAHMNGKRAHR